MAMAADDGSMALTVIYHEVKAWIAQQEAYEAQYNKPAPLTDVQRMALHALRLPTTTSSSFSSPPPPPPPPPAATAAAASGPNYIGMLMEYYQKRNQPGGIQWAEETSGVLSGGVTGRVCRVTILESLAHESGPIEHFPAAGYGLNDDGSEQRFTSKKAAKSFAAKCAVEWLAAQGFMPSHLQAASSPPPKMQAPLPAAPTLKRAPQSTGSSTSTSNTTITPPPKRQATTAPMRPDSASEAAAVATLCHELNLPAPKYEIVETAPNSGVFDGRAQFEDYGDLDLLSLTEAGVVQGVGGKDATRQAVAAKLLERLREIEAVRDAQLQLLTARLARDV